MWTALSSIVFGSKPTSEMDALGDRSVELSTDMSASKATDPVAGESHKRVTEDGFTIHARLVKTHNTLRQALETLEGSIESTSGAVKIITAELGAILVGDATGLPEDTVYDIIPARGQPPLESFINQCVINQDSIRAWTRIIEEALKRMFDAFRELRQPVERTSFVIHTALAKMLPLMEHPNLATFNVTTSNSDDEINNSLRNGIECLEYLVKTHKDQLSRCHAEDLKPFLDGAKQALLSVDDAFHFRSDVENDATFLTLLRRTFGVSDPVKLGEALEKALAVIQEDYLQNFVDISNNLEEFLRQLEGLQKTHGIEST